MFSTDPTHGWISDEGRASTKSRNMEKLQDVKYQWSLSRVDIGYPTCLKLQTRIKMKYPAPFTFRLPVALPSKIGNHHWRTKHTTNRDQHLKLFPPSRVR